MGLLSTTFYVPHFFDYRKQPSFSLYDLPWVPVGRFMQLLIREGRDVRPGRNSQEQPLDKVLFPYQWIYTTVSLSYFADTEAALRWEKLMINDSMLPTSLETPGQLDLKVDSIYLTTKPSKEHPWPDHILFEQLL